MDTNFLGMVNCILNGDQSPSQRSKNLLAVSSSENLFNQKVALLVEDLCKEAVLPIADVYKRQGHWFYREQSPYLTSSCS